MSQTVTIHTEADKASFTEEDLPASLALKQSGGLEKGRIKTDSCRTNIPGIFAAGDVKCIHAGSHSIQRGKGLYKHYSG